MQSIQVSYYSTINSAQMMMPINASENPFLDTFGEASIILIGQCWTDR